MEPDLEASLEPVVAVTVKPKWPRFFPSIDNFLTLTPNQWLSEQKNDERARSTAQQQRSKGTCNITERTSVWCPGGELMFRECRCGLVKERLRIFVADQRPPAACRRPNCHTHTPDDEEDIVTRHLIVVAGARALLRRVGGTPLSVTTRSKSTTAAERVQQARLSPRT